MTTDMHVHVLHSQTKRMSLMIVSLTLDKQAQTMRNLECPSNFDTKQADSYMYERMNLRSMKLVPVEGAEIITSLNFHNFFVH